MTKYVFVTGGVVSGLGKGITAASLGRLLKARGYRVAMQKMDPYYNVDPGLLSPLQHLIRNRNNTHIIRRTIRRHLQIRLRRINNLQQPIITTLKPWPQRVIRSRRITRCRQRPEKRHITQHALNQHHHNKSGYNSCAHTMTRLKTLFRKNHKYYSKGCMSH